MVKSLNNRDIPVPWWYVMDMKKTENAEKEIRAGVTNLSKGAESFSQEFMDFLKKYQVIGLAVAFIIGTAASTLVTALVKDLIMPFVGVSSPAATGRL